MTRLLSVSYLVILGYAIAGFESGDVWLYNGLFHREILYYAIIGFVSGDVFLCYDWFRIWRCLTMRLSVFRLDMLEYVMINFVSGNFSQSQDCFLMW